MEVGLTDKLSLINEAIASLQSQVDELKRQLAGLQAAAAGEAEGAVLQVTDIEPVEIYLDDDMPSANASVQDVRPSVSSAPLADSDSPGCPAPLLDSDIPDNPASAEDSGISEDFLSAVDVDSPGDSESAESAEGVDLLADASSAACEVTPAAAADLPGDDLPADNLPADGLTAVDLPAGKCPVGDFFVDDLPADNLLADDLPADDLLAATAPAPAERTDEVENSLASLFGFDSAPAPVSINDAGRKRARKTVKESLENSYQWRTAVPGPQVKSIISAIPLNDRVQFVNTLFRGDALLYQKAIAALNSMNTLDEVEAYVGQNHPEWNLNSDVVYRFMMAVRRKIR